MFFVLKWVEVLKTKKTKKAKGGGIELPDPPPPPQWVTEQNSAGYDTFDIFLGHL